MPAPLEANTTCEIFTLTFNRKQQIVCEIEQNSPLRLFFAICVHADALYKSDWQIWQEMVLVKETLVFVYFGITSICIVNKPSYITPTITLKEIYLLSVVSVIYSLHTSQL